MRPIPNLGINLCDILELKKALRTFHNDYSGMLVGCCVCGASGNGEFVHVCQTIDSLLQYAKNLDHLIQDYKNGDLDSVLKSLEFYANPPKEG